LKVPAGQGIGSESFFGHIWPTGQELQDVFPVSVW